MGRRLVCSVFLWCLVGFGTVALRAAEQFGVPACAGDFGAEVLLNAPLLEAMAKQTEPEGERPDRRHETLFIVAQHYLERVNGLLLISRSEPTQRPRLLAHTCAPYPEAPTHIRAYFAALTEEQQRTFMTYHDLVLPPDQQAPARPEAAGHLPAVTIEPGAEHSAMGAFAIDVYEVTNAQYRQFIEAKGYTTREYWSEAGWAWLQNEERQQPNYWENERLNAPEQPVVGVTWYEADAYCRWAGKTLPAEPQWELACRGPDGRPFPWGDGPPPDAASDQPEQQAEQQAQTSDFEAPRPVGSTPARQSPYGVHDMAGNVLEWTGTVRDGQQRVLCGGSGFELAHIGCGVRFTLLPGIAANFIGFRCVSETPET